MISTIVPKYISFQNILRSPFSSSSGQLVMIAAGFAVLQLLVRLGAMGGYGFHQDELLYMSLTEHLAWGYRETPPFIAAMGAFSKFIFGDSVFAMRLLPAFASSLIVFFTGRLAIAFGGRQLGVTIACAAITFSSAFLASGALFVPQVFDELCWVLSAYLLVKWNQDGSPRYVWYLGIVVGLAMMVKYTFVLYGIGLLLGLALHKAQRKLFVDRNLWIAIGIAFLLFLPNLLWQVNNSFAALKHFNELQQTQLVYITTKDFIVQQLLANGSSILVWLPGLLVLFVLPSFSQYRFYAVAFAFVMLALLLLHGKPYYGFGAYPPLFAIGGVFYQQIFKVGQSFRKWLFFGLLLIPNLLLTFIVLPFLPIDRAAKVFEWTHVNLGLSFPLKWEDQKIHNMNQNYADMIGWDELARKTAKLYYSLPITERGNTIIFAENYGQAGAIDYYQELYGLPAMVSLNSSYATWAPAQLKAKHIIYIGSHLLTIKGIGLIKKHGEVIHPYSRIKGQGIYLLNGSSVILNMDYEKRWQHSRF